ncbi:protein ABHD15-like isoform X2 [Haliotis asinina]|uniref:protein ABHD15-like isoform X2 n=1 Tax=Haliotis asinina TaxID=109174 RepID=UPI00353209D1
MQASSETMYVVLGSVVAIVSVVVWYYRRNKHTLPELHCLDSDLHRHILKTKPGFTSPYRPPFWLQNNHLHTIIATLVPKPKVTFKREYVDLDDGGVVALDWAQGDSEPISETSSILIVVPGLTASAKDNGELCSMALKRGYRVVVFNKRGHGDSVLTTPKLQGFGDTKDMRHCVEYLRDKYPEAKLVGIGSSAGSALIASYMGEYGADAILVTGVCISPGYDALELFTKRMNFIYEYLLLSSLKRILKKHDKVLSPLLDLGAAYRATRFIDFDTHVYCKFYGYKDIIEYWKYNNPMRNIINVKVPFMCINSMDDPICMSSNIEFGMFKENPDRLLVTTDKGGHCGFLEESTLTSWSDRLALDYIDAVLEFKAADK